MKKHGVSGEWQKENKRITLQMHVWSFQEENLWHVFSPHLDIIGVGQTEEEAFDSFRTSLKLFLDYTTNKETFFSELKKLGWQIRKKNKPFIAPSLRKLLNTNEMLKEVVEKGEYRVSSESVDLPVYA